MVDRSRPHHIGLNAQLLSLTAGYRSAGISWYIYHLLEQLAAYADEFRFTAFSGEWEWAPAPGVEVARTRWPIARPAVRIAWEQLVQPLSLARRRVDLVHSLAYVSPALWRGPSVVTILDLSFVIFPERFRPLHRLYLRLGTRWSARRARRVIAISENTRRDAMRFLGLDRDKVEVVYCGVDPSFRPVAEPEREAFRRARGLPARFVLFVGTLEPRKNVVGLLKAYRLVRQRWRATDGELPALVVAGAKGWYYAEIYRQVEELKLNSQVLFAGYVPAAELPLWYNAALIFAYPSQYEGFGLPVLEAMACGTPVVTSDRASLPEIVGDAGRMAGPEDHEGLADAMYELMVNSEARAQATELGLHRARLFSWTRAARETVMVYREILAGRDEEEH